MSKLHPIVAVTGSSGSGTSTVGRAFDHIFRRLGLNPGYVHGDAFFRYNRVDMQRATSEAAREGRNMSHFGPDANLLAELESLFSSYGRNGTGMIRTYIKDREQAEQLGGAPGEFTPWEPLRPDTDLLFYEGLHGGVATHQWGRRRSSPAHLPMNFSERRNNQVGVDLATHVDFLLGVVPAVNLEWIQKIHRDCGRQGCSAEAVTSTILRRMSDYVNFIVPQFAVTDVNLQRVPVVDTSNPFVFGAVPSDDESLVIIHFRDPARYSILEYVGRIPGAFLSRPNTLVVPGGKLAFAIDLIFAPVIHDLVSHKAGDANKRAG